MNPEGEMLPVNLLFQRGQMPIMFYFAARTR